MKILIHSNAPWVPTGYGLQGRMLADSLMDGGHTVAFSAFAGLGGADVRWKGYQVMPAGQMAFGIDVLLPHAQRFGADLIITCMDFYKLAQLGPDLTRMCPVLAWVPVDCYPLSQRDKEAFAATGAIPVAMSEFGWNQLNNALPPETVDRIEYAPHAVDLDDFYPMKDRQQFRKELGIDDKFTIGLCAANKDTMRKAFPEQFRAFGLLIRHHPESMLLVHSLARSVSGLDLGQLAHDMGISEHIMFSDSYVQDAGLFDTAMMRRWYNALDVLTLCSYGEGFGIPMIEAQACGTPVVATDCSALSELNQAGGWRVPGQPFWNPIHQAFWTRPNVEDIVKGYNVFHNMSVKERENRRHRARAFATLYGHEKVYATKWRPIIEKVGKDAVVADTTVAG